MPICAVFGCSSSTRKQPRDFQAKNPLTFHKFPALIHERKKWTNFCSRKDKLPSDPRVCSLHFRDGEIKNCGFR